MLDRFDEGVAHLVSLKTFYDYDVCVLMKICENENAFARCDLV